MVACKQLWKSAKPHRAWVLPLLLICHSTSISPCIFTIGVPEDVVVERLMGLMKLERIELFQYLDANKHSNMGAEAHPRKKPALSLFLYATYEAIERHEETKTNAVATTATISLTPRPQRVHLPPPTNTLDALTHTLNPDNIPTCG